MEEELKVEIKQKDEEEEVKERVFEDMKRYELFDQH